MEGQEEVEREGQEEMERGRGGGKGKRRERQGEGVVIAPPDRKFIPEDKAIRDDFSAVYHPRNLVFLSLFSRILSVSILFPRIIILYLFPLNLLPLLVCILPKIYFPFPLSHSASSTHLFSPFFFFFFHVPFPPSDPSLKLLGPDVV